VFCEKYEKVIGFPLFNQSRCYGFDKLPSRDAGQAPQAAACPAFRYAGKWSKSGNNQDCCLLQVIFEKPFKIQQTLLLYSG
jgi:hypothetical protein